MSGNRCGAGMRCVGEGRAVRFKGRFQVGGDKEFNRMLVTNFVEFEFSVRFRENCPLRAIFSTFQIMDVKGPL